MRFSGFMLILAVMCTSFASGQNPSGGEAGIEGVITLNPVHPGPVPVDAPGSGPLANASFVVKDEKDTVASEFTTDNQGHFRVSLPPGHYKVSLKGRKGGPGRFGPFDVEVVAGKMTKVQWECDSGIR
jgi:hypothetical protein